MEQESESGAVKKHTPSSHYKFCEDKFYADNRSPLMRQLDETLGRQILGKDVDVQVMYLS